MKTVLIVDYDSTATESAEAMFAARGHSVTLVNSLADAKEALEQHSVDVMFVEVFMPDGNGLELIAELGDKLPAQVVLMTEHSGLKSAVRSIEGPGITFMSKPIHAYALLPLAGHTAINDSDEDKQVLHSGLLVGKSEAMQRTYELVRQVAPMDTTVLINGESGTGKELVAESIHRESGRCGKFVAVNCGALASELLASELFGHEKGSFTGASRRHIGMFEQAEYGTLFLDEITEMPLDQQTHLLRALESGRITRIGAEREIETKCRIVAASNRDLGKAIESGALREDLYYRLSIFPIELAPLRHRLGDVRLLAEIFLRELNGRYGMSKTLCADAVDKLEAWHWPGNIRELKHTIQRSFISTAGVDRALEFPEGFVGGMLKATPKLQEVGRSIHEVERAHILNTLEHFDGNKKATANALGVSLKTLYNRMATYEQNGLAA